MSARNQGSHHALSPHDVFSNTNQCITSFRLYTKASSADPTYLYRTTSSSKSKSLPVPKQLGAYGSNNKERGRSPPRQEIQLLRPRYDFDVEASPWPRAKMPERPVFNEYDDNTGYIVMISLFYAFGFLIFCFFLTAIPHPSVALREKPWVPAWARRDACLTPLFFVLPAFFWPLVFPAMVIGVVSIFLMGLVYAARSLVGRATSCCGIPLPRQWLRNNVDAVASSASDLEMGTVDACSEVGAGGEPGGELDDIDPAGERCAGSGESDRPPPYTSLPSEENDSRESDSLLAKNSE